MNFANISPDFWVQNEGECLEQLNKEVHWNSIPSLNANDLQNLQDKRLVRFRGMVQDMFNPEFFYESYEIVDEVSTERRVRNGKFTDITNCKDTEIVDHASENNVTSERHTLVVISVPGLNAWVENLEAEQYKMQASLSKGELEDKPKKRSLEVEDMEVQPTGASQITSETNKKQCTSSSGESSSTNAAVSREHLLNFPLPERTGKACHVKVYKNADTIKLNDVVEVVGFLSVDPVLTDISYHNNDCGSEIEIQTHNPPPSLIPRVHAVMWKKIGHNHNNLLVNGITVNVEKMQYLKKELHIVLTQLFMGDSLAAEYFIYHLISRVYLRNGLLPLGKFSLNISHIPVTAVEDYGKQLYEFIELLLPKSHYLPMTLENMNETAFVPKKDYECDRLTAGILQLSDNTHLVLDETKLTAGHLNASGVRAVGALANAIKNQRISYDFNYYPMEFDCDIPFLILSEGKSLLPSDVHVALKPDEICIKTFPEIVEAGRHFLKPDLLDDMRVYLAQARHARYELADNVQELVQNEFVQMRQEKTVTPDDLHQLLVVARLVCLSEGKASLDADCWRRACDLEAQRKKQCSL